MKYYLVKHRNGLFAYKEDEKHDILIERIRTFRLSDDNFFNKYCFCCTMEYFPESVFILFKSDNLDEIVERAALEAL